MASCCAKPWPSTYQVARLTDGECAEKAIELPKEYVAVLRRAKRLAIRRRRARAGASGQAGIDIATDESIGALTAVYGGGVLVFDEFGRLKYHIHNDVFGSRQTARLKYLWEAGLLRTAPRDAQFAALRLSTLHLQRAIGARRFPEQGW